MSERPPISLYPIMVIQSRYGGIYEGGAWFAVAGTHNLSTDIMDYLEGDDCDAIDFWAKEHDFPIATGQTPNEAVSNLVIRENAKNQNSVPYKQVLTQNSMKDISIERTSFYQEHSGF